MRLLWVIAVLALAGCSPARLPLQKSRLDAQAVCCEGFRDLPYLEVRLEEALKFKMMPGVPVYDLDGRKSYVQALGLPNGPKFYISVRSFLNGSTYRYFVPRLIQLNEGFAVVNDVQPRMQPKEGLLTFAFGAEVRVHPAARYLVIVAADPALRNGNTWDPNGGLFGLGGAAIPNPLDPLASYQHSPEGELHLRLVKYELLEQPE